MPNSGHCRQTTLHLPTESAIEHVTDLISSISGKTFELLEDGTLFERLEGDAKPRPKSTILLERRVTKSESAKVGALRDCHEGPDISPHKAPGSTKLTVPARAIHPFFLKGKSSPNQATKATKPPSPAFITERERDNMPKALVPNHKSSTPASVKSVPSSSRSPSTSLGTTTAGPSGWPPSNGSLALKDRSNMRAKQPTSDSDAYPKSKLMKGTEGKNQTKFPLYSYIDPEFGWKTGTGDDEKTFNATRVYVTNADEADDLIGGLKSPVGFDMEWKVSWKPGCKECKTALMQLADRNMILLVQVSRMKSFPPGLKAFLQNPTIIKTGANILGDGKKIIRDFGFVPRGFVELSAFGWHATEQVMKDARCNQYANSLNSFVETYCERSLDKGNVRKSNWELNPLNEKQLQYAANDAHSAYTVWSRMEGIAREENITLDIKALVAESDLQLKEYSKWQSMSKEVATTTAKPVNPPADDALEASLAGPSKRTNPTNGLTVPGVRPAQYRAYKLWHEEDLPLDTICGQMRSPTNPLQRSTVISYIVFALKGNSDLPYSRNKLIELIKIDEKSWKFHETWAQELPA
ncbi:hypothetical protein FRB99_004545 [Tulasnella sp. 403]|nr:hypothetical protein FRB99_004545 [Tulasnella sp. 403]